MYRLPMKPLEPNFNPIQAYTLGGTTTPSVTTLSITILNITINTWKTALSIMTTDAECCYDDYLYTDRHWCSVFYSYAEYCYAGIIY